MPLRHGSLNDLTRSGARSLRLSSAVRGAMITYGIAAYGVLLTWTGAAITSGDSPAAALARMVAVGLALQGLLLLVRWLVRRYERRNGQEGQLMPFALYVFELAVDAASVLLFALATFRGILSTVSAV